MLDMSQCCDPLHPVNKLNQARQLANPEPHPAATASPPHMSIVPISVQRLGRLDGQQRG